MPWVGLQILESNPPNKPHLEVNEFLETWRDQLPEDWRYMVDLKLIEVAIAELCLFLTDSVH